MNKVAIVCSFVVGGGLGAFISWRLLKTRYEDLVKEEINSVREMYSRKFDKLKDEYSDKEKAWYDDLAEGYNTPTQDVPKENKEAVEHTEEEFEEKEGESVDSIYIITADEYGECDYDTKTLVQYADGVIADEYGLRVEDPYELIGNDYEDHWGDDPKDPDTVYVRNDIRKVDYEVQRDYDTFYDED